MSEITGAIVMLNLLTALVDEWNTRYSRDMIWQDPEKISLLNQARDELIGCSVIVPERVRDFYREIYLRDMWERNT